jgi:3-methyl-2-oxobutanoate hydroxymethyltransferase
MVKTRIADLQARKKEHKKISMVTAYDYPTARIADEAGIDIILVGDSYGMVSLGYESTTPVTMEEMLTAARAVSRGARNALLVGDMPFMSFQSSIEEAVRNAGRFVKEGGMDAVKIEGGQFSEVARAIARTGIPVMGHVALSPQTALLWGSYPVQGKDADQARKILDQSVELEGAGAFSVVLEMLTAEVAELITRTLSIPTIGIGAGPSCDGQVLVLHDILGLYPKFTPKFAKQYLNISGDILRALTSFKADIENEQFPTDEHTFHMSPEEQKRLREIIQTGSAPENKA